jgi:hypothetical protein
VRISLVRRYGNSIVAYDSATAKRQGVCQREFVEDQRVLGWGGCEFDSEMRLLNPIFGLPTTFGWNPEQVINGGAEGDRTPDLMTASHALSQLSYGPNV